MAKPLNLVEALHPYSLSTTTLLCENCNDERVFVNDTETGQLMCSDCGMNLGDIPW